MFGFFFAACGGPQEKPEDVAQQFLSDIRDGKMDAAYNRTSFGFQAQQTLKDFEAKVRDLRLDKSKSATWQRDESKTEETVFDGKVKIDDSEEISLQLSFHQQRRHWLISGISTDAVGPDGQHILFSTIGQPYQYAQTIHRDLPAKNELDALVRDTLMQFNQSLDARDFSSFYDWISKKWQNQISLMRFNAAFQPFLDQSVHLNDIQNAEVVYDEPPRIESSGILLVTGICKTQPENTHFILKYIYEVPKWRLFAIELELLKPKEAASPGASAPEPSATPVP